MFLSLDSFDLFLVGVFLFKGASAGAGSGEFDIYRGCRRRELIRQEFLEEEDKKVKLIKIFINYSFLVEEFEFCLYKRCLLIFYRKKQRKNSKKSIWKISWNLKRRRLKNVKKG